MERKKYLTKVVFYENYKDPQNYYRGIVVERDGEFKIFDLNIEKERKKYIDNFIEMDGEIEKLPDTHKIQKVGKKLIYTFMEVKNNSCYSLNDWCDFSVAFSDEMDNDKNNGNDNFVENINVLLDK